MKQNSIHWGLLALSLLCGGALCFETASISRAQAPQTPWGTVVATVAGAGPAVLNPNTNAVYFASNYTGNQIAVLDGKTLAYPVCCQYDESVIICRSGLPRLSNNASRFSAGFSR